MAEYTQNHETCFYACFNCSTWRCGSFCHNNEIIRREGDRREERCGGRPSSISSDMCVDCEEWEAMEDRYMGMTYPERLAKRAEDKVAAKRHRHWLIMTAAGLIMTFILVLIGIRSCSEKQIKTMPNDPDHEKKPASRTRIGAENPPFHATISRITQHTPTTE